MNNMSRRPLWISALVVVILFGGLLAMEASSRSAYQACRRVMLDTDGYAIWKLQSTRPGIFSVQYDFYDGYNTTTCEAVGFGRSWTGSKRLETLVACMLALTDTGGNECPRRKFGVSP